MIAPGLQDRSNRPKNAAMRKRLISFRPMALTLISLCLVGCGGDQTERVDRLEAELREIRSDTRDEVAELRTRVITAESKVGVSSASGSFDDRIGLLEGSIGELIQTSGSSNEMVYLRPLLQGHAPIQTDHGIFLVRIEGMDLNVKSSGYTVHLTIGNPQALAVQQFTLIGDHGGGTPELDEGEAYSLENPKIQAWQKTLKPFEYRVSTTLEPFAWTPFDIEIEAENREELEMIRFRMIVENAQLNRQFAEGGASAGGFAHISVDSPAASVLKTDYGAFLIIVKKAEKVDLGTRLDLEIGNPYGFKINQARFVGDFGPALPKRESAASGEDFAMKMRDWSSRLQPFEALITTVIDDFRWSKASILVPGDTEGVKFLRCQLRVEDVTLPAATGTPGRLPAK
jgi:hypothetical protein